MQHSLYAHLPPPLMEEGSGDHHHQHQVYLHPFLPTYDTSPLPCAFFLSRPCQEGSSESIIDHQHDRVPLQEEVKEHVFSTGSSDEHSSALRSSPATVEDGEGCRRKNDAGEGGDPPDHSGSGRWMSSKMRFVRKMMGSDKMIAPMGRPRKITTVQEQQCRINGESHNSPPAGTVRICSDCNTTKTPLWRSGPRGPKSLCNACGIRQRKARRAMAAAAALTGAGVIPAAAVAQLPKARKEQKRSAGGSDCRTVPFKKRFKFTAAAAAHRNRKSKLHFDHEALAVGMSKNSAFQRVLGPRDEKEEAAILLMALSCGLIRG